jgi:hypothetical protein
MQERATLPFRVTAPDLQRLAAIGAVRVGLVVDGEYQLATAGDGSMVVSEREHPATDAPTLEIRW